jgi:hypothetical protein
LQIQQSNKYNGKQSGFDSLLKYRANTFRLEMFI